MLNITICDDERTEIEFLKKHVRKWAALQGIAIYISDFESAESMLFAYEDDKSADILLLDIQMKGMDGVSLAKKIRISNKEIQIIFVTGYMDYISDGYDVEALHYLLKPVSEDKLFLILNRAVQRLKRNDQSLLIKHDGISTRIPFHEIRYLEVHHNYVTIHADTECTVKSTLNELEKKLAGDNYFFRVSRSYIINLRYLKKCSRSEIHMKDGAIVPLPRGMYDALNRAIIERL
jgi:DNA-binding LytR/AlgR family response regulator